MIVSPTKNDRNKHNMMADAKYEYAYSAVLSEKSGDECSATRRKKQSLVTTTAQDCERSSFSSGRTTPCPTPYDCSHITKSSPPSFWRSSSSSSAARRKTIVETSTAWAVLWHLRWLVWGVVVLCLAGGWHMLVLTRGGNALLLFPPMLRNKGSSSSFTPDKLGKTNETEATSSNDQALPLNSKTSQPTASPVTEMKLDMVWEVDDTLETGDDDYVYAPLEITSPPNDKVHPKPVRYGKSSMLDDVDLSQRSSCGTTKCFWPSVSDPEHVGYILAAEGYYDGLYYAYDMALDVSQNCSVRHTYAAPPVLMTVSQEYMAKLASLVFNPSRNAVRRKSPFVFAPHDTVLTIQKVHRTPTNSLLYGTGGTKWPYMVKEMEKFRNEIVISRDEMKHRLHEEAQRLQCVFDKYPSYWVDYQAIIDIQGRLYHMDMDQTYWNGNYADAANKQKQQLCLRVFDLMIQGLTDPVFNSTVLLSAWKR